MKRLPKRRKIIFICILILLSLLIVESAAFTLYYILNKQLFPWSKYQSSIRHMRDYGDVTGSQDNEIRNTEIRLGDTIEVIHPYLGFVLDPKRTQNVSDFGFREFRDDRNPFASRTKDELIIGMFGGSFAEGVYEHGSDALIDSLEAMGRKVTLVNVTMGGYKQPQQLLALTYFLSLGAEFDIVINIDGFNEVALPPVENIPKNVSPLYPRAWYFRTAGVTDQQALRKVAGLAALDLRRKNWARLFVDTKLYYSIAMCLVWEGVNGLLESKRSKIISALQSKRIVTRAYVVTGPPYSFQNDDALYEYLAMVWKRSSLQMRAICEGNGIGYYHFLQPNQYVKGSKPMTKDERKMAINNEHPYRPGVVKGYPLLRRYGNELMSHGIKFHDLTMIFAGIEDHLYTDDCCHVNGEGYKIIAITIGTMIKEDLLNQQENNTSPG
jgi:hypothetical protein